MTNNAIVVTGGFGFIGYHLTVELLKRYPDSTIYVIDSDQLETDGNRHRLEKLQANQPRLHLIEHDLAYISGKLHELVDKPISCVYHLAAESSVDRSIVRETATVSSNVYATQVLLNEVVRLQAKQDSPIKLLYTSTDEVFGSVPLDDEDELPISFDLLCRHKPSSVYAATKSAGEMLVRAAHTTHGLRATITRSCNVYGPFQDSSKLIPRTILRLLTGNPMTVYGDGSHARNWIYVNAVVDALIRAMERTSLLLCTFHFQDDLSYTNNDLVRKIHEIMGKLGVTNLPKEPIVYVDDRPGHDRYYNIRDNRDILYNPERRIRDIHPEATFHENLEYTIKHYIYDYTC